MNPLSRVCILTSSLSLALSCYGEDASLGQSEEGLPPPAEGVQYSLEVQVPPGTENEYCQFFQMGDDELLVNHDQIRSTNGSHHVVMWTTSYTEIPSAEVPRLVRRRSSACSPELPRPRPSSARRW